MPMKQTLICVLKMLTFFVNNYELVSGSNSKSTAFHEMNTLGVLNSRVRVMHS